MAANRRPASVLWVVLVALAALACGAWVGAGMPRVLRRQGQGRSTIHWEVLPNGRVWGVACQSGYLAEVESLEKPTALRVTTVAWPGPEGWKVQLIRRPVELKAGMDYALRYRIRAEGARPYTVFIARPSTPSQQRPLSHRGEIDDKWQNATLLFTPAEAMPDAELCFELGESTAAVVLEDVELVEADQP